MSKKNIIVVVIALVIAVIAFLIYQELNVQITNENHKLLFTILSDGGYECGYVELKIYDDKTYEYYGTGASLFGQEQPKKGKYHYNDDNILEKIVEEDEKDNNTSKNKIIYIIESGNEKYYVGNNNKYVKKLIHSIFLYPIRVNLNKCPSE